MKNNPVYLLLGPENGEKDAYIKNIKKAVRERTGGDPEEYRFYSFESNIEEMISLIQNGSLFSDHKIVVLQQTEGLTRKADIEPLTTYIKNPSENATLILVSDQIKVDGRIDKVVAKDNKKIFWELFEDRKQDWIRKFFREQNVGITQDALELILEMVDNNTLDLQRECRNLVLYYQDRDEITEQDVDDFVYHSKEENVFSLFDKVSVKDLSLSLEVMEKILHSGEYDGVQLLTGMAWQFQRLHRVALLLKQHYEFSEACSRNNIRGKKAQNALRAALRSYSVEALERIIGLTSWFDYLIRSMKSDLQGTLLSLYLYSCIIRDGEFNREGLSVFQ